ncbi:hypothetical protein [Aeromicrobium sp. UC242_57]|uniref:hypothetical protein n=1 Tax=Aeromicrobium sp. UC242_57 TaxID=3374624 RepID=UPI0037991BDC
MSTERRPGPIRRWARARPSDIVDVFVYVVVLNLAVEYVPQVISEGFTLSLLTAVLLKIALEVVLALKDRLSPAAGRLERAGQGRCRAVDLGGRCGQQVRGARARQSAVR